MQSFVVQWQAPKCYILRLVHQTPMMGPIPYPADLLSAGSPYLKQSSISNLLILLLDSTQWNTADSTQCRWLSGSVAVGAMRSLTASEIVNISLLSTTVWEQHCCKQGKHNQLLCWGWTDDQWYPVPHLCQLNSNMPRHDAGFLVGHFWKTFQARTLKLGETFWLQNLELEIITGCPLPNCPDKHHPVQ